MLHNVSCISVERYIIPVKLMLHSVEFICNSSPTWYLNQPFFANFQVIERSSSVKTLILVGS